MTYTYKTNHAYTTKSLTEWYFGKATVKSLTTSATREHAATGKNTFKYFRRGIGLLTIISDNQ